jgi:predicted ATPase/DNA-binding SARP family transcriptional activator
VPKASDLLQIRLFGRLSLHYKGQALSLRVPPRALSLLAYLLLNREQAQPRDAVAFKFWPDLSETQARTKLRAHLHYLLESAVPNSGAVPWMLADKRTIQWNPAAPISLDVADFERLAAFETTHADAVALYTGDLLVDLDDEWLAAPRTHLRETQLAILAALVESERRLGNTQRAIDHNRKVLEIDPWRESAVREHIALTNESGDRAGAMQIYRQFAERLKTDLGVDPMPETITVYELLVSGENEGARPAAGPRNNLPFDSSSFIGRELQIEEIHRALNAGRLLTVVGSGGVGKTRTAVEAARRIAASYADGVWFVDLAATTDPARVPDAIATSVCLGTHDFESDETLCQELRTKQLLIVIDNCEHLIDAAAKSAVMLLQECSMVKIIATSRQPLAVRGEKTYRIPSLAVPASPEVFRLTADEAIRFEAIALFVDRARASNDQFDFSDESACAIVEICQKLDGIALAIELTAARASAYSPKQLRTRLDDRFAILTSGFRNALPRQQTLHALIDWSHELLDEWERRLFARLSAFRPDFTLEAATAVCSDDYLPAYRIPELLASLVDKSLVVAASGESPRYRMLESVRAFARDKADEKEQLSRRHAEYFESLAREFGDSRSLAAPREWIASFEPEADNFRAALEWALRRRSDIELGARLVVAVASYLVETKTGEASNWILEALDALRPGSFPDVEVKLCEWLMRTAQNVPSARLRAACERGIELCRESGDSRALSNALRQCAEILGWYFRDERNLADTLALEAIAIARSLDDPQLLGAVLRTRGLTIDISNVTEKRAVLEESLHLFRGTGNELQIGTSLTWISEFEFSVGEKSRAIEYGREAVLLGKLSGSSKQLATANSNLAAYASSVGEWDTVRTAAAEAIRLARVTLDRAHLTFAVQSLAALAAHTLQIELAARLIGFCDARCGVIHAGRQADQSEAIVYRNLLVLLKDRLGEMALSSEMARGSELSEDEAAHLALALSRRPVVPG